MATMKRAAAAFAANQASRSSLSSCGPWTVALKVHCPGSQRLPNPATSQASVDGNWAKWACR